MAREVFLATVPVAAVQFTKLAPGEPVRAQLTPGTFTSPNGSIAVTLKGSHMSLNKGEEVIDAFKVYAKSPTVSGSSPDAWVAAVVDGIEQKPYQVLDLHIDRNIAPWPSDTLGGPADADGTPVGGCRIGHSLMKLAVDALERPPRGAAATKMLPRNVALKTTGWKATESFTLEAWSQDGFDATAGGTPLLVVVYGTIISKSLADAMQNVWNSNILLASLDRSINRQAIFAATHQGAISMETFGSLPGGAKQSGTKIYRLIRTATNGVATTQGQRLRLTRNVTPLQGGANNIAAGFTTTGSNPYGVDQYHDLGFQTKDKTTFFQPELVGVRWASNLAYWGIIINGVQVPSSQILDGFPVYGEYSNPQNFGVAPGQPNRYVALPRYPGREYFFGDDAVFYIQDDGTASIPAGSVYMAISGPYVEGVRA